MNAADPAAVDELVEIRERLGRLEQRVERIDPTPIEPTAEQRARWVREVDLAVQRAQRLRSGVDKPPTFTAPAQVAA